ncbi:DUF1289 domain-containing protein [Bosea sp. (in: a-proteobacteria)]|uniref:DUF1289 domain-containing protein n=1 Tax=Bosea sp. (in: a-proteobacteria) TaxID=1871050 RepID=UPI0035249AD0
MTAISSPCVKLCQLDPATRLCLGCGRSLNEIGRWSNLSETERRAIMTELPARLGARKSVGAP